MFETVAPAPPDPILGLNEAFAKDPRPAKINLSVGVFKDEAGTTPILRSVKEAERRILDTESSKSYLGMAGLAPYAVLTQQLLFGADHPILQSQRARTLQTPGGTGALRVAADFVKHHFPTASIWCSQPTWANHPQIFSAAGLPVETYRYLDAEQRGIDFAGMIADISRIPRGDVVVLHACCHNPTGVDPSATQWQEIAKAIAQRGALPLIDFAYQGFGDGLVEDAAGLLNICATAEELIVASSYSKNFGLYNERVGALTAVGSNSQVADAVLSQLKMCVRTNYSNPPFHGGAIVATVLADETLRATWEQEVANMRDRINNVRSRFADVMSDIRPDHDFSFVRQQRGMFSYSRLSPEQVDRLRDEHSIYIVRSGRINVAGITPSNIRPLCEAIAGVL